LPSRCISCGARGIVLLYAAIAVSPSHRKRIIAYIHNQKQHHADGTTIELLELDCETYETDEEDSSPARAAAGA
jgi:hypothetical protein